MLVLMAVLLLGSCKLESGFTFNSHHFGDTIEQVNASEGNNCETRKDSDYQYLYSSNIKFADCTGYPTYVFKDNKLIAVNFLDVLVPDSWREIKEPLGMADVNKNTANIYIKAKDVLSNAYGNPDKEEKLVDVMGFIKYKLIWKRNNYGIVLLVPASTIVIEFSSDSSKAEKFYNTLQLTDLLSD